MHVYRGEFPDEDCPQKVLDVQQKVHLVLRSSLLFFFAFGRTVALFSGRQCARAAFKDDITCVDEEFVCQSLSQVRKRTLTISPACLASDDDDDDDGVCTRQNRMLCSHQPQRDKQVVRRCNLKFPHCWVWYQPRNRGAPLGVFVFDANLGRAENDLIVVDAFCTW